jgi:hypothetical protein
MSLGLVVWNRAICFTPLPSAHSFLIQIIVLYSRIVYLGIICSRACENLEPTIKSPLGFVITKSNEELLRARGWMDRFIIITPKFAK